MNADSTKNFSTFLTLSENPAIERLISIAKLPSNVAIVYF